jgi:hypothetical protein
LRSKWAVGQVQGGVHSRLTLARTGSYLDIIAIAAKLFSSPKISVFRMLATNFVSDPDNFSENGPNVHLAGHGKDKVASSKSK